MGVIGAFRRRFTGPATVHRVPLFDPDFPLVVLWSEKAGCTSAARWFYWHTGKLEKALAYHPWVHNFKNDVFFKSADYEAHYLKAMRDGRPVIKFTRNPYARAYSGFLETCKNRVLTEPDHWATKTRASIVDHAFGAGTPLDRAYNFQQFVDWLVSQAPDQLDVHLAPQFTALEHDRNVEIFQLEHPGGAFSSAEIRFGLRSSAVESKLFTSGHHHRRERDASISGEAVLYRPMAVATDLAPIVPDVSEALIADHFTRELGAYFATDFEAYGYQA